MADQHEDTPVEPQELLRSLDDVRGRIRTTIWALADLEHLLTETLDHILTPACEAVGQLLGATPGGAVTTH
jgi:hypothetical protein